MPGLKRKGNASEDAVLALYAATLTQIRNPAFYIGASVPDTFDGRFDLLLLHVFLILQRLMDHPDYNELSQSLFDTMFKDMDQTLREMGIGDMGVPKHMKRMMKAFNGRMHAYQEGLTQGDEVLKSALTRNLYGTVKELSPQALDKMVAYIHENVKDLKEQDLNELAAGQIKFSEKGLGNDGNDAE
ncbi:MAG: ubiquinol-cytochrome C chaperone family protein [Alphaproteobacteria bacterium]|nr:ubiquinol-cytochrome C chaperone family protein [Alphaproteobacteria bacterium]